MLRLSMRACVRPMVQTLLAPINTDTQHTAHIIIMLWFTVHQRDTIQNVQMQIRLTLYSLVWMNNLFYRTLSSRIISDILSSCSPFDCRAFLNAAGLSGCYLRASFPSSVPIQLRIHSKGHRKRSFAPPSGMLLWNAWANGDFYRECGAAVGHRSATTASLTVSCNNISVRVLYCVYWRQKTDPPLISDNKTQAKDLPFLWWTMLNIVISLQFYYSTLPFHHHRVPLWCCLFTPPATQSLIISLSSGFFCVWCVLCAACYSLCVYDWMCVVHTGTKISVLLCILVCTISLAFWHCRDTSIFCLSFGQSLHEYTFVLNATIWWWWCRRTYTQ